MADEPDLASLVEQVETALLGGQRKYTRREVAERAGLGIDEARALWRSLGFASGGDGDAGEERTFTDSDVQALRDAKALQDVGGIDDDALYAMGRMIGQTFARLASWQGQIVIDAVAADPQLLTGGADGNGVVELVEQITPLADSLHSYVWRRQLASNFSRVASNSGANLGTETSLAVGFADMAGFTTFTRNASEADLRTVLGTFETVVTDVVTTNHGQVVKTIGDEVLFTADTPAAAAAIALDLVGAADTDDVLPAMRAGLAFGPVVARLGDVFGQTVNIASRLTSAARTGSVLVDKGMSEGLAEDDRYALSSLRPMSVRGYHHLRSWRLRHAP